MGFVLARHKTQARETVTIPRIKVDESQRICRQILVRQQQLTGIWFSSSLGRKNQPNNNNLSGSCMYGNIRLPVVSLPSAASWKRHSSYFSSLPVCFWVGWDQKLTRMVYLERLTAFLHAPLPWEEPSVHLFPPNMYIPQLVFFFFWGGQIYFLARREGFPMTSVVIIHVFFFCVYCERELRVLWPRRVCRRSSKDQYRTRSHHSGESEKEEHKGRKNFAWILMFSTPFFIIIIVVFLACRRLVVVDPISLFIPLNQNQFDMPSLSLVEEWRVDIENSSQL